MDEYDYVWEKLRVAVDCLATGHGPLRERLIDAWISAALRLQAADFPSNLRQRWTLLVAQIDRVPGPDGTLAPSIHALTDDEASKMAEELVSLFDWVCHTRGPEHADPGDATPTLRVVQ